MQRAEASEVAQLTQIFSKSVLVGLTGVSAAPFASKPCDSMLLATHSNKVTA